jgi:hypothetical protein
MTFHFKPEVTPMARARLHVDGRDIPIELDTKPLELSTDYDARLTLVPRGTGDRTKPEGTTMSSTHDAENRTERASGSGINWPTIATCALVASAIFVGYQIYENWSLGGANTDNDKTNQSQVYNTGGAPTSPLISAAKQAKLYADCTEQAAKRQARGPLSQVTWDSPFKCRAHGGWQEDGRLN